MLRKLVDIQYQRNDYDFHRGTFRVRGDIVEIFPAYEDRSALRIEFFDETIESIGEIDPIRGKMLRRVDKAAIYPASHYVTGQERMKQAIRGIRAGAQRASAGAAQSTESYSRPSAWNSARFTIWRLLDEMGFCPGHRKLFAPFDRAPNGRAAADPARLFSGGFFALHR